MFEKILNKYYQWRCSRGKHRLFETVGNPATGMPSTGYVCIRCGKAWDWEGNEKEKE